MMINGDPNTASCFSLCVLLGRFLFLSFTPTGSSQRRPLTLRCVSYQSKTHRSFLFFFLFFFSSSLTTLITVVQILTAVVMVIASRGLRRRWSSSGWENERKLGIDCKEDTRAHTHGSLCANIFHVPSCFAACTIGSLPWLQTIWPPRVPQPQCQKMNLMRANGDKCSFSTKPGAKRSLSWDQLTAIYPLH